MTVSVCLRRRIVATIWVLLPYRWTLPVIVVARPKGRSLLSEISTWPMEIVTWPPTLMVPTLARLLSTVSGLAGTGAVRSRSPGMSAICLRCTAAILSRWPTSRSHTAVSRPPVASANGPTTPASACRSHQTIATSTASATKSAITSRSSSRCSRHVCICCAIVWLASGGQTTTATSAVATRRTKASVATFRSGPHATATRWAAPPMRRAVQLRASRPAAATRSPMTNRSPPATAVRVSLHQMSSCAIASPRAAAQSDDELDDEDHDPDRAEPDAGGRQALTAQRRRVRANLLLCLAPVPDRDRPEDDPADQRAQDAEDQ